MAKGYVLNWPEKVFVIKKVKNTVLWTYVISDLMVKKFLERFTKRELQKSNQKEFRVEKVIKKTIKYMLNGKGYNNPFNSWIEKKDTV